MSDMSQKFRINKHTKSLFAFLWTQSLIKACKFSSLSGIKQNDLFENHKNPLARKKINSYQHDKQAYEEISSLKDRDAPINYGPDNGKI